jgi:long-chain acyl-CoA synthetase
MSRLLITHANLVGGENIYPTEVEDRLAAHPSIAQSSVVGLNDEKYQEIVAAFIEQRPSSTRPSDEDIRNWVRQKLGRHKAPTRIFWVGKEGRGVSNGVGVDSGLEAFPSTASGKIKKIDLREFGNRWLNRENRAKL